MSVSCNNNNIIIPKHVAIIMDGNGRWAKSKGLLRTIGHKKGAEAVRVAVEAACEADVSYLTLFAFSSENWKRPKTEVAALMELFKIYLKSEVPVLHEKGIKINFIGNLSKLDTSILKQIKNAENLTAENKKLNLIIAVSYGSREEIITAAKNIALDVLAGKVSADELSEKDFSNNLYTKDIPDPDLVIRTSGEKRISNFLLWQAAYSEFVYLDVLWPDFSKNDFENAVIEYSARERRYGK